jgi:ORF6N domain
MASLVSKRVIVLKPENVAQLVFFIRGEKVMFDADLAMLYGVEVRSLNQAVARNRKRFPADFAFQLTDDELAALRSQIVTSNTGRGGRRYLPYAFTEQGVAIPPSSDCPRDYGVASSNLSCIVASFAVQTLATAGQERLTIDG